MQREQSAADGIGPTGMTQLPPFSVARSKT